MIYLEPRSILDTAISRIENVIIYDFHLLVDCFQSIGMSHIDAIEHIYFNIIGVSLKGWPTIEEILES